MGLLDDIIRQGLAFGDRVLGGDGSALAPKEQPRTPPAAAPAPRPESSAPAPAAPAAPATRAPQGGKGGRSRTPDILYGGTRELIDHLAPSAMKIEADRIQLVGEAWVRVRFIEDLPTSMGRASLDSIYGFPGEIRVSLLVKPLDKTAMREQLRQRRTSLHAENMTSAKQGQLPDYNAAFELSETEAQLAELEASHLPPQELFWTIALYARTTSELEEQTRRLEDFLADCELTYFRASLRQEEGLHSVEPFGLNFLGHGRNITPTSLGTMFPFARRLQADIQGIPYGIDRTTGAWVILNDFAQTNSNLMIIGEQGSGKSMFLKYKTTWAILLGMRCYVLDLEGEFQSMCAALNGTYLDMALNSPHHMNLLDLNPNDPDAWNNGLQDMLGWVQVALSAPLMAKERNVVLIPAYERVMAETGIVANDPATWTRPAPVLSDLFETIRSDPCPEAQDLAARLVIYATGVYANAFSQPTDVNVRSSLVVFGLKNVHPDMQALRMRQINTFIWANVLSKLQPTLVVIDEAWRWLQHPTAAADLEEMARRFRKRNAGVHIATQHGGDLSSSAGATVIRDTAAMTILFRQTSASAPYVARLFGLNEVETHELLTLDKGESLFLVGPNHIPLFTVIPPTWYPLWTTNPEDLRVLQAASAEQTTARTPRT